MKNVSRFVLRGQNGDVFDVKVGGVYIENNLHILYVIATVLLKG
jgi:hypothetical protein